LLPYPLAPQLVQMEVEPWPNNLEKKGDDSGNMMGTHKKQGKFPIPNPFQTPKGKNHV